MTAFSEEPRRLYTISDAQVRAREHEMHAQGLANRTALAQKDPTLTEKWFEDMAEEMTACDNDALHPERIAAATIERQDRDADIKEARPILQDLYFYARKAYPLPTQTAMVASFGNREYTHAGVSVDKMLDVMRLGFRRASDPTINAKLLTAGMQATALARLGVLAGEVQEADTRHAIAAGDAQVGTQEYVERLNALWNTRLPVLNQAATRAFREDVARRRLFRLYDPSHDGETHELTVRRGHPHAFALDAIVQNETVYEFRVLDHDTATGRVTRSVSADEPGPTGANLKPMKRTDHALYLTGTELGAAGDYLVLECLTGERLHVRVRVLPPGE